MSYVYIKNGFIHKHAWWWWHKQIKDDDMTKRRNKHTEERRKGGSVPAGTLRREKLHHFTELTIGRWLGITMD